MRCLSTSPRRTAGWPTTGSGSRTSFSSNQLDFIQEILINQPQNFIKERTQRRMKILLGEGLITSDGEIHRRQRRIAAPAFHRQRIQAYGAIMVDRAAHLRGQWHPHQPIDIASQMMQLALQVVARTLFNTDVTDDVLQINEQVNVIMELYNYLIALPRAEAYLNWPLPGLIRFRRLAPGWTRSCSV